MNGPKLAHIRSSDLLHKAKKGNTPRNFPTISISLFLLLSKHHIFFSVYRSNSLSLLPPLLFLPPSFLRHLTSLQGHVLLAASKSPIKLASEQKPFSPGSRQTKYILDASAAHSTSIANTQCQCRMWCVLYIEVKSLSRGVCGLQSMLAFSNHNHNLF